MTVEPEEEIKEEKPDFTVEEITDIQGIMEIVPFESEILGGVTEGQMSLKEELEWLYCLMNDYPFIEGTGMKVITFKKDGKLTAYFMASVVMSKIKQMNRLHVYRVWVEDGNEEARNRIIEILNEWCRGYKIRFWSTSASVQNEKLLESLEGDWGFKKVSVVLERKVK